ncbi:MAG: FKBP-type peptidyl-prolyl cis-trans isomerase [Candidatus Diapherotrites archaeon]
MKKIILLMVFVVMLFGCIQNPGVINETKDNKVNEEKEDDLGGINMSEVVETGDSIKVDYVGKFPDTGEIFDKSEGRGPLEFTVGAGQMIKGFDSAVLGMKLNEEKTVTIPPEDAYGTADSGQKFEVPLSQLDEGAEVGSPVYASNGSEGKIIEINGENAVIEFIHPLAGKTLEFWIKVVEINKA